MEKIIALFLFMLIALSGCSARFTTDKESDIGPDMKIGMGGVNFSIDKAEKLNEVKPAKPSGYYNYYEEKDGYIYFVVTGKAENKSSKDIDADNIIVRGLLGSKEYEGKLLFSNTAESDLIKELIKDEEQTFYFILLVKDQQEVPDTLEIFYNNNFEKTQKKNHYDESIRWTLPAYE